MHRLSMAQALGIWSDMEAAYYGKNHFGGDTAEIYIFRLQHRSPVAETSTSIGGEARKELAKQARETLHSLLVYFMDVHEDIVLEVDGRPLGPWLRDCGANHRVHVRIVHGSAT